MKKGILLLVSVLMISFSSCSKDDSKDTKPSLCEELKYQFIQLQTQEDVEELGATGCDVLIGGFFIGGDSPNNSITDLSSLSGIRTVGELTISNNKSLKSLKGLEGITYVNGSLIISGNDELIDISGLADLDRIEEKLEITDNEKLADVKMQSLRIVGNSLDITYNNLLMEISGLNSLEGVYSHINISGNESLKSISGLNNLRFLSRTSEQGSYYHPTLKVRYNPLLTNFCGLKNFAKKIIDNDMDVVFEIEGNTYNPQIGNISSEDWCSE